MASEGRLADDVLTARLAKEKRAIPRFRPGGKWQREVLAYGSTLAALHKWMHIQNGAYSSSRLLHTRAPIDPKLAKSY